MRRKLAVTVVLALVGTLGACKDASESAERGSVPAKGVSVSFDGVAVKYSPADGREVDIPFTLTMTRSDVRKADSDFVMDHYAGGKTARLGQAGCTDPAIDDIIPVTFTPHYKDKATADVKLGVSAQLEVEDADGNELNETHPQGVGIVWLNQNVATCATSMDEMFSHSFAITNGYNVTGAIVLHGGRDNYDGYKLKVIGGKADAITNITGDGVKPTYGGIEVPLLP